MKYCDLHIHSVASDGTFTPEQIVERARIFGLSAIAIADHDSIDSVAQARSCAREFGIDFIDAVELSTSTLEGRLHILGYFIDPFYPPLVELLKKLFISRRVRIEEMCKNLTALGFQSTIEEIEKISNGAAIGRPHLAEHLINIRAVRDIHEAFEKYLSWGRPAYVKKWAPLPAESIAIIHDAGGLAVVAHPGVTPHMMERLPELIEMGADGIEAYYPRHTQEDQQKAIEIAKKHNLLITGGSDCHGTRRGEPLLGIFKVRYELFEKLRDRWSERKAKSA